MGEKEAAVIDDISPDPCEKEPKVKAETVDGESPVRSILCLKSSIDLKRFDETEDCVILDFDPFESFDIQKLSMSRNHDDDGDGNEVSIIFEKGQVACRDYPHPRHLCVKFPFGTTPNETHCHLCYCYVCDSAAPCARWTSTCCRHCDASCTEDWKQLRARKRPPASHN